MPNDIGKGFILDNERVILLLDVDGVLNSLRDGAPWPDMTCGRVQTSLGASDVESGIVFNPKIRTSKHIGKALLSLDVEIRWLTTWGNDANKKISKRAGLPSKLPVSAVPDLNSVGFMNWKIAAAVKTMEEGRPVVWVDDDLTDDIADQFQTAMMQRIDIGSGAIKIHRTNCDAGLTPEDIEDIREFVDEYRGVNYLEYITK